MKSGTIFDNFIISDDIKEAEEFGKETWGATKVGLNAECWLEVDTGTGPVGEIRQQLPLQTRALIVLAKQITYP